MRAILTFLTVLSVACATLLLTPPPASACGGLFCDNTNPVNQAAERIIFADNGDGTVTAVIEIQYEGPAEKFSWVLPIPGVPEVEVSSTTAMDRIQQATNPQYNLQVSFEDGCGNFANQGTPVADGAFGDGDGDGDGDSGVIVLAAGTVGPFDYEVISVDDGLDDTAQVAIDWLNDNGYDLTELGPEVLRPYLEDGLNLLAFRLTKDADSGSIRPIWLTYDSDNPFIPIRPTAVAANDDMGVMVWVVGADRAIPKNYKALELNEALIDWFNPMDTYNDVVIAAADEAQGQGFVTEYADGSDTLEQTIVFEWERDEWARIQTQQYDVPTDLLFEVRDVYSGWDGFADAVRMAVTLPEDLDFDDFLQCPVCYAESDGVVIDGSMLLKELFENVIKPMFDTQDLLDSRPYVTRLYTTMSAEDMTLDPIFDFNGDLDDVSNVHTAEQIISCDDDSWVVKLPQGDEVHGEEGGVWPMEVGDQPAARRIVQLSTSGDGEVVEDRSKDITELLAAQLGKDGDPKGTDGPDGTDGPGDADGGFGATGESSDVCGCRTVGATSGSSSTPVLLLGLALILALRRRTPRRS